MTRTHLNKRGLALGTAGLLLTAVLAGCNSGTAPGASPSDAGTGDASSDAAAAALPLSTGAPVAVVAAPPVSALPAAAAVPVRRLANRRAGYAYLDRAYYQQGAVQDAPPDYTFDDNGVRPWTWATRDGSRVITEPVSGGYRYYYYQAGADSPYLVRDPRYSYAYDNGALVDVFSASGQEIDYASSPEQVGYAGRYLGRGQYLYRGASSGQRVPVNARAWNDHRAEIAAQHAAWHQQINNNPDWSAWNDQHRDDEQRVWNDDRQQHQAAAQQFGQWQQQGYQGQQPQFYGEPRHSDNHTAAIVGGVVAAGAAAVAIHELTHHDHPNQGQNPGQNPGQPQGQYRGPGNTNAQPQNPNVAPQNAGARPGGQPGGGHYGHEQSAQPAAPQYTQPSHPAPPQTHQGPPAQPGRPEHAAPPQYAQPSHPAPPQRPEGAAAQPGRPERMMTPHNSEPAPHYAAPQAPSHPAPPQHFAAPVRTEVHTAPTAVGHVTEVIQRPIVPSHPAPPQAAFANHPAVPSHPAPPAPRPAEPQHPGPQNHEPHEHP